MLLVATAEPVRTAALGCSRAALLVQLHQSASAIVACLDWDPARSLFGLGYQANINRQEQAQSAELGHESVTSLKIWVRLCA